MSGSASLPASIAMRDLMLALLYGRRRMLLIVAVVMAATIAIAFQIERKYEAKIIAPGAVRTRVFVPAGRWAIVEHQQCRRV